MQYCAACTGFDVLVNGISNRFKVPVVGIVAAGHNDQQPREQEAIDLCFQEVTAIKGKKLPFGKNTLNRLHFMSLTKTR